MNHSEQDTHGTQLFARPWGALTLHSAPGFHPEHWPDMADVTWAKAVHGCVGATPPSDGRV